MAFFAGASEIAAEKDRGLWRTVAQQDLHRLGEPGRPACRARIVECHDEIGRGGGFEPGTDRFPWGQEVGERDRTEIVTKRRARPGGGGLRRRDTGTN